MLSACSSAWRKAKSAFARVVLVGSAQPVLQRHQDMPSERQVITRQSKPVGLWVGLGVACVLHASLLAGALLFPLYQPRAEQSPASGGAPVQEIQVDFEAIEPAAPAKAAEPAALLLRASARESASRPVRRGATATSVVEVTSPPPPDLGEPAPPRASERRLSLAELGIGGGLQSVALWAPPPSASLPPAARDIGPGASRGENVRRAEGRLEASLRTGGAEGDQKRGLGPEGPLVAALNMLTYASATLPDGSATFRVTVNEQGRVTLIELLGASGDRRLWDDIRRELLEQLARRTLRPAGHAATLELAVSSSEELPSGASPGLDLDVGGIMLERGRGSRSSQLSILTPKVLAMPFAEDPDGVKVPVVSFGIAGVGDPGDLGAKARRVVRTRLTKLDMHSTRAPASAPATLGPESDEAR